MALIAVTAARGAPGVSVTSLALTLAWPRTSLLAECDPSGGSALTGYLRGETATERNITQVAVADYHGRLQDGVREQLLCLHTREPQRWLLPGVTDPTKAAALDRTWEALGGHLRSMERPEAGPPIDVIADCGRIPALHAPVPLLRQADVVLLVVGRTLGAVTAAASRMQLLRDEVERHGAVVRLVVRGTGDYSWKEIANYLDTAVLVDLPEDDRTATMLSQGTGTPRPSATLLRAARFAAGELQNLIEQRRAAIGAYPSETPRGRGNGHV